jgi:hypothetical protein
VIIPIQFDEQIQPGTFEHAIDYLGDNEMDLAELEIVYQNGETGAPAVRRGGVEQHAPPSHRREAST